MKGQVRGLAVRQAEWTSRSFNHDLAPSLFPSVLERFRGTPLRVADLVARVPTAVLRAKPVGKWSVQEHIGHLIDLEELGQRRLSDFQQRKPQLAAADMSNQKTNQANHNQREAAELVAEFAESRRRLVSKLELVSAEILAHRATHPRLNRLMNVPEWVFFMCEH